MEKKRVTVKRLYKGGQKPDGWFGCFARERGNSEDIPLTGVCKDAVKEGSVLDVAGEWKTRGGWESFACTSVVLVTSTKKGIVNYFAGKRFPGVGTTLAERLYDAYGDDVFQVIQKKPDEVRQRLNISNDLMEVLIKGVTEKELDNFLRQWLPALTDNQVKRLKREFGDKTAEIIAKQPYRLIEAGISFKTADEVAINILHLRSDDMARIEEGTLYVFRNQIGGDMYLDLSDDITYKRLYEAVMKLLGLSMSYMQYAQNLQTICADEKSKLFMIWESGNQMHLYERALYYAELTVTEYINRHNAISQVRGIDDAIRNYESSFPGPPLFDEQKKAVITSARREVSCITGGPGRGKTSVISCLARVARRQTMLLAPTGKAAKRMTQQTGLEAMTIARFLLLCRSRDYSNKYSHFIVDEASMVSIKDMAALMDVLMDKKAILTLVGDVDQLQPVDAGSPFYDIIKSGIVPVSYLTVNHRTNARSIVDNADRVHDGNTSLRTGLSPDGEIEFLVVPQKADDDAAVQYVVDLYKDALRKKNISDVAVICPMNKGNFGVKALNLRLQNELNKEHKGTVCTGHNYKDTSCQYIISDRGAVVPGMFYRQDGEHWTNFRIGDRVMQTVNHADVPWFITDSDVHNPRFDTSSPTLETGAGLYNGDCGTILDFTASNGEDPMYVTVGMDDGRIFRVPEDMLSELTMAYAMTVHKSQGCEYDTVIYASPFALLRFMNGFACRNLVYTAITRAKSSVQIVGSKEALDTCIVTPAPERKSLLKHRLRANLLQATMGLLQAITGAK